eukprot:510616-Pyramimonas_sp.AAC.1
MDLCPAPIWRLEVGLRFPRTHPTVRRFVDRWGRTDGSSREASARRPPGGKEGRRLRDGAGRLGSDGRAA